MRFSSVTVGTKAKTDISSNNVLLILNCNFLLDAGTSCITKWVRHLKNADDISGMLDKSIKNQ